MFISRAFVIPCYNVGDDSMIVNNIKTIRKIYPLEKIIVVDSGSPNKDYFSKIMQYDVDILDVNNIHYDTGAYWEAYRQYPDVTDFVFLHDSLFIGKNIDSCLEHDICSFRYFYSRPIIGGYNVFFTYWETINWCLRMFLARFKVFSVRPCNCYGFDNKAQKEWVKAELDKIGLELPKTWVSLFGPVLTVKRTVLDKLVSIGADTILPTNKLQQMGMERVWGIVLIKLGYDITQSLQGNHFSVPLNYNGINKIILARE